MLARGRDFDSTLCACDVKVEYGAIQDFWHGFILHETPDPEASLVMVSG